MEQIEKTDESKRSAVNNITRDISSIKWAENLTFIDLSNKNIKVLEDSVSFPRNLTDLNLSRNNLVDIPSAVLTLPNLKALDLSSNSVQNFNDTPSFCHTIEVLNLANNHLVSPPYWVWSECPSKLRCIDLSGNTNITNSLKDDYFDELLQFSTLVTDVKIFNCRLRKHLELLGTFSKVRNLELGMADYGHFRSNFIECIPCPGLDRCCDIEKLNLSNMQIYNIDSNISIYKNLIEINLSQNNINTLPKEFSHLDSLEICILSCNRILYLPEDIVKLKKLKCLHIDSNILCMLPENISELPNLKVFDLYENCLYEVPEGIRKIEELDLAQNYFEEPDDVEYLDKKSKLRQNFHERVNGRKYEVTKPESVTSIDATDDEELMNCLNDSQEPAIQTTDPPSSPEDWDSDDYWIPGYFRQAPPPHPHARWEAFVKRKMDEGYFCPMDIHPVSISKKVQYEKMCNPRVWQEVEGQFDDYSEDDS